MEDDDDFGIDAASLDPRTVSRSPRAQALLERHGMVARSVDQNDDNDDTQNKDPLDVTRDDDVGDTDETQLDPQSRVTTRVRPNVGPQQDPTQTQTQDTDTDTQTQDTDPTTQQPQQTHPLVKDQNPALIGGNITPIKHHPKLDTVRRSVAFQGDSDDNSTSTPKGSSKATSRASMASADILINQEKVRINNLIDDILAKGKTVLFSENKFLKFKYPSPAQTRPHYLTQFFEDLFPTTFRDFTKDTRTILGAYLEACTSAFDAIAIGEDKADIFCLLRFLAISICYGIDRALQSLSKKDHLIVFGLSTDTSDRVFMTLFDKDELRTLAPSLPAARKQYYTYFRIDDFDPYHPSVPGHKTSQQDFEAPTSSLRQKILTANPSIQVRHVNQPGPLFVATGTVPKSAMKQVKEESKKDEDRRNDQQQQQQQTAVKPQQLGSQQQQQPQQGPRQQQQQQQVGKPQPQQQQQTDSNQAFQDQQLTQEQQNRINMRNYYASLGSASADENQGIRVSGSNATSNYAQQPQQQQQQQQQNITQAGSYPQQGYNPPRQQNTFYIHDDFNNTMAPTRFQRRQKLQNFTTSEEDDSDQYQPSRNDSRNSNKRISFSRQNSIYMPATDDDFTDDNFTPDPPPVSPSHFRKQENAYYNEPLSREGFVHNNTQAYRMTPVRTSGLLDSTYHNLTNLGYSEDQVKNILGTSVGVAQSISSLLDEKKRQNRTIVKPIPPPPKNQDFRIRSFDYRRDGTTVQEILGNRFCHTRFPTDAIRLQVMREILQAVVMDQLSSVQAYKIALAQLAEIDVPQVRQQEIQHCLATSLLEHTDDPDIIPPPILGHNNLGGETIKTFINRITSDKDFNMENLTGGAFKNFLNNLSSIISNAGLRESEAYQLLRKATTGLSLDAVNSAEFEHKIPFSDFWISMQKTHKRASSTRDYEKRLKQILNESKVENIENTLKEIIIFNEKIHAREPDPNVRKFLCQRNTLKDLRHYIRKHYSSFISQINTLFMNKLKQHALQKNDPTLPNENIYHAGKTHLFHEIACDVLSDKDPDDQFYKPSTQPAPRQNHTYVNATNASFDLQDKEDQEQQHPPQGHFNRAATPGFNRQQGYTNYNQENRGPSRNGNFRQNDRRPQDQDQRPYSRQNGRQSGFGNNIRRQQRKPNFKCHLCNILGHSYRECRKYKEQQEEDPSKNQNFCNQCGGKHKGPCRSTIRGQTPHPAQQGQPQERPQQHMNVASVNINPVTDQPPPMVQPQQQQQDFQQPRNFTPGLYNQGNYRNFTPGPYNNNKPYFRRPYDQNYNNRPRSQNGSRNYQNRYRNDRNQDFRPQQRYNDRNDGRRSGYGNRYNGQNGYNRSYSRNQYYGNRDQGQYTDYRQRQSYRNNTQDDGPPHQYDRSTSRNGKTYQQNIDDLANTLNTVRQHQQHEKQQGLGNDGFQAVHPSVHLAAIDTDQQFNDHQQSHPSH